MYFGVYYANEAVYNFPHHLLSTIFCFVSAVMLILILLPRLSTRLVSFAITGITFLLSIFFTFISPTKTVTYFELDSNSSWTCEQDSKNLVDVEISPDGYGVTLSRLETEKQSCILKAMTEKNSLTILQ